MTEEPKPNLGSALEHLEAAIVAAQTAQDTGEANMIRLESLRLALRDQRGRILDMLGD